MIKKEIMEAVFLNIINFIKEDNDKSKNIYHRC